MNKISAVIKISRPINFLITFFSVIVAGLISSKNGFSSLNIIYAGFSAAVAASAGNIINDIFDIEIDKINRPKRVLPSKKLSIKYAVNIYLLFNFISLGLSFLINFSSVIIVVFSILLIYLYSKFLKKIPLLGNISVAFLTGLAFIFGAAAVGNFIGGIIPAVFAFFSNFIREIIKDMQDVKGDESQSVITFPQKYGFKTSIKLINVLTIFLVLLTCLPFVFKIYKIEYFIIVMIIVNPLFVYILKVLNCESSINSLGKTSSLIKISMVLGLIAIFAGN